MYMTQSCRVLTTMDTNTTTFVRKNGCTVPWYCASFLGIFFLFSLVATGLLVYYFAPCHEKQVSTSTETDIFSPTIPTKKDINIRLPRDIVPDLYELWLIPFIWEGNFTFHGEIKILINVTNDTNNVTLHAVDIKIDEGFTSIREYSNDKSNNKITVIKITEQKNDSDRQFHVIKTSKLKKGKQYIVHLKFIGYLNDDLHGFYRSSYTVGNQTRWIATTQFEPTDARRAFPCFDEPALKAKFQINIARPQNMTSISNMPKNEKTTRVPDLDKYVWDHYERSVPMSTYLVAFIIFDFDVRKSKDGDFRVWARHDAIAQTEYSLNIGPKMLKFYEDYFKIKYPLPKMDIAALPDFEAGAMENWGLMTFRETAILYQKEEDGITDNDSKQLIALILAHELSHQWFGNLVTPSWWTDLWLNEGFASYMEYIGTNAVEPEWRVLEQYVVHELQSSFTLDALESSHPISIEVDYPDEINEIFDTITYVKGSAVIRMMDHFLTTDVFKKGLHNYLNEKKYQSAESNDLWYALTKQAHKDKVLDPNITIKKIMDTWTLQTGFPVVTVLRNYSNGSIILTQERFLLDNNVTKITSDKREPLWWIPITYTTEKQLNFNNTQPTKWMKAERSITLNDLDVIPSQWILFNVQETGYYRVNYDTANWELIIKQLNNIKNFKKISVINRAQLIDDALNLARAGKLDYEIAFNITSYLAHETEYLPWKAAFRALSYLNNMLIKTRGYDKFRLHMLKLLDNIYEQVGFVDKLEDPQMTVFNRINILNWACYLDHEHCVMKAVQYFNYWRNTPNPDINNPIPPNLKSVVYCTAIRVGGQNEWKFAWQRYLAANVGSEKDLLLQALSCTKEIWLLSRYLDWAVMENSGIRKQDATRVFESVASNIAGRSLTFDYIRNKWMDLRKYFGISSSISAMNAIIPAVAGNINTKYELKDLINFVKEHLNEFSNATRTLHQVIENAESNIRWFNKHHMEIYIWLQKNIV